MNKKNIAKPIKRKQKKVKTIIFNYFCSKKENKCPEEMLFNLSGMKKFNGQFSDSSKLIEMSENDVVNAIIFSFLIAKISLCIKT